MHLLHSRLRGRPRFAVVAPLTAAAFRSHAARPQLNVEVEDSPAAIEFYSGHGFVHSSTSSMPLQEGRLLLSGERDAALQAIEGSLAKGLGVSAVMMNLLGRLRHDAGNLQGAVDAYLKALEVVFCRTLFVTLRTRRWGGERSHRNP